MLFYRPRLKLGPPLRIVTVPTVTYSRDGKAHTRLDRYIALRKPATVPPRRVLPPPPRTWSNGVTMNLIPNLPPNWNPSVALDEIRDVLERGGDVRDVALTGLMLTSRLIQQHRINGGPALNPLAIFAPDLTPRQRMGVRMDETVTKIQSNIRTEGSDARLDLASDLLLDYITRQREGTA